ncbi:Fungal-trans domain-containing protein [Fusarium keratoplasticum]|nr:Fungal-trans domain-containing protein [Fusarium keratoplasticum]
MSEDRMSDHGIGPSGDDAQNFSKAQSFEAPTTRFVCDCGKSYMRKEHLRRHQSTHDGEPQKCHICGQLYWRKDVLQRHLATHEDHPPARPRACDACRANKTKCDGNGVVDCTFCKKKSISCHYSLRRSRARKGAAAKGYDATRFDHPSSHNASTDEPAQKAAPAVIAEASGLSSMANTDSPSSQNAPSPPHPHIGTTAKPETPSDTAYLKMILQELSTSPPRSSPLHDTDFPDTMETWMQNCFESYVNRFHHRWHIITAPTYELKKKPYDNAASVLMIGSYFSHAAEQTHLSIEIHEKLMGHYLQLTESVVESKRIPDTVRQLETYQSILMNIIFGLSLAQERTAARASHLCGRLIETMRSTGFFVQSQAQSILQSEFPGNYSPWIGMFIDEWKRLICNLFKVETEISLLYRQCPRLLNKELSIPLPSTFSLRNCHDFGTFTHREKRESSGRNVKLSMMMRYPDWFLPDPLLVEDIHLGLCGLAFDLFDQPQLHSVSNSRDNAAAISSRANIVRRLAIWAVHIQVISEKLSSDASNPGDHDLVTAYLQREDETSALSYDRSVVKDRIQDIFQQTTTLYDKLQTLLSVDERN